MSNQAKTNPFPYSDSNKRYYSYDYFLRKKFGQKCAKLPIDAGFTCPNRDGTKGKGGCIYCSARGSGDFCAEPDISIKEQLEKAYKVLSKKWENPLCIAYFQAFTNTYAAPEVLREKYLQALSFKNTVGLSIATRADCLDDEICDLLSYFSKQTFLTVELGLQTIHDSTANLISRGHSFDDFVLGYEKLRRASPNINIGVHLINGLPTEDKDMMLESAKAVAKLRPDLIKLHLLHVIKDTPLASMYERGEFECLTLEEYVKIVVSQLEVFPPETVIGRLTGDGMESSLIAPIWSRKKLVVMNEIDKLMYSQNTWQGRLFC